MVRKLIQGQGGIVSSSDAGFFDSFMVLRLAHGWAPSRPPRPPKPSREAQCPDARAEKRAVAEGQTRAAQNPFGLKPGAAEVGQTGKPLLCTGTRFTRYPERGSRALPPLPPGRRGIQRQEPRQRENSGAIFPPARLSSWARNPLVFPSGHLFAGTLSMPLELCAHPLPQTPSLHSFDLSSRFFESPCFSGIPI